MSKPIFEHFTEATVAALALPEGERESRAWDYDGGQRSGLGVRMVRNSAGYSKRYIASYRLHGQDKLFSLTDVDGTRLDDARAMARAIVKGAEEGKDPQADKRAARTAGARQIACPSFRDFAADYLTAYHGKISKATDRERERYLTKGYFAPWTMLRLNEIDKGMVSARVKLIAETHSPDVALAARAVIYGLFKSAIPFDHITDNPVDGSWMPLSREDREEKSPARPLSDAELRSIWHASGDDDYGRITKLAILLGGRRQEIGGMRWSEIDGDGNWTIRPERVKLNKKQRAKVRRGELSLTLPLPQLALDIIGARKNFDRDQIFGTRSADGFVEWSKGKRALDGKARLNAAWRFHDLRHTMITGLKKHKIGDADVRRELVRHARLTNDIHADVYEHDDNLADRAKALQAWADHVATVVSLSVAERIA